MCLSNRARTGIEGKMKKAAALPTVVKPTVGRWLTVKFLEWQNAQMEVRSISEWAEVLSDNSHKIMITRPSLSLWMNDKRHPTGEFLEVLAEKLGPELYDILGRSRPDANLAFVTSVWHKLSPGCVDKVIGSIKADLKL
jgi:hypothetical protein